MSNDLVSSASALPREIALAVKRITLLSDQATVDFHPDAVRWLEERRRMAAPGSRKQCHEWMAILILGVNSVKEHEAIARETAIWAMCHHLPAFVWCQKTVNGVWAKTPFLPGPGEVLEVLSAYAKPLLDEIVALEKIAAAPRPETPPRPGSYVMPSVPEWCFDRSIRKRSRVGYLQERDDVDDCPQPRGSSIGRIIEPMVAKAAGSHPEE